MKISEIKENPKNPRKISADHLEKLVKSIKDDPEMMELRPIVYDPETMEVLGGNQRLAALKKAGYKEIPEGWAVPADKLTEEQKKRFVLKDNANLGEWDFEVLAVEFGDFDLESLGIEAKAEDVIFEPEDTISESELKPYTMTITFENGKEMSSICKEVESLLRDHNVTIKYNGGLL